MTSITSRYLYVDLPRAGAEKTRRTLRGERYKNAVDVVQGNIRQSFKQARELQKQTHPASSD